MNNLPGSLMTGLLSIAVVGIFFGLTATGFAQTNEVIGEEFAVIIKEYDEQSAEKRHSKNEIEELRDTATSRIFELVDECGDPELAIEMLHWVISKSMPSQRTTERAYAIIAKEFLNEPGITDVLDKVANSDFLNTVIENSSNGSARVVATYLLAMKEPDEEARETALLEILEKHPEVNYRGKGLTSHLAVPLAKLRYRVGRIAISKTWGVRGWPTLYVLDATGEIRFEDVRSDEIDEAIMTLLEEMGEVRPEFEDEEQEEETDDDARDEGKDEIGDSKDG